MRAKALLNQSQSSHTTHVLFIINLPVQVAQSSFVGFQGDPWVSCHIDELRPGEKGAITLEGAQGLAVSELFYGGLERKPLQYERQESDFTRNVEGMVFEHMISTENEENGEQEEEEHEEVEKETTYKEKIEEMMEIDIEGGEEEDEKVVDKEEIEEEENMEEEAAETGSEENGKGETKETGSEVSSEEEQEKTGSEVSNEEEQEKTGSEENEKTEEDEARSEKISEEEESENSKVEQDMKETEYREKSGDMHDLSSSYSTQTSKEHMDDKEIVRNSPNDVEITESVNAMSQRIKTYSDMYKQCVRLNSCIQAAASRLQDSNKQRATERVHLLINIIPRKPVFPLGTYNLLASVPGVPCLCVYCAR